MRKSNQQRISLVIRKLLKEQNLDKRLNELDILDCCKEILGRGLMRYITEVSIREQILVIKINSSVVRNELAYQKNQIIEKINNTIEKESVKDIILK